MEQTEEKYFVWSTVWSTVWYVKCTPIWWLVYPDLVAYVSRIGGQIEKMSYVECQDKGIYIVLEWIDRST